MANTSTYTSIMFERSATLRTRCKDRDGLHAAVEFTFTMSPSLKKLRVWPTDNGFLFEADVGTLNLGALIGMRQAFPRLRIAFRA